MSAEDVRKLHSKFILYGECDCDLRWKSTAKEDRPEPDSPEYHDGKEPVFCDVVGYTCNEGQSVCWACNTDEGEVDEYTENGEYPCRTLKALEKP